MANRVYTEDEVARLIQRAVELEAKRSVSRDKSTGKGLTISELEQITAESGIDPELIHKAATELDQDSSSKKSVARNSATVKKDEIVSELWLELKFEDRVLEDMVTELNHKYGTSDQDINWWDNLWNNYDGKAKVRKSSNSMEWQYSDEFGYYTTRVLLQSRVDKFRIRVSKRQLWGMTWNTGKYDFIYPVIFFPVFMALGGLLSFSLLSTIWPGFAGGAILSSFLYPVIKYIRNRSLQKHQDEVTDTAHTLADLAVQLLNISDYSDKKNERNLTSDENFTPIEIPDVKTDKNDSSRLSNILKE